VHILREIVIIPTISSSLKSECKTASVALASRIWDMPEPPILIVRLSQPCWKYLNGDEPKLQGNEEMVWYIKANNVSE
jgi:hypothetical protein